MVNHTQDTSSAAELLTNEDIELVRSASASTLQPPLFASDKPEHATTAPSSTKHTEHDTPWHILVVDDDESVLRVTELALRRFTVESRPVMVHRAESASTAKAFLKAHGPVSVVIADVVMESEDAGLALIAWIRADQRYDAMRLVIRTGQAGLAPEETVLNELDINDYWPKAAISAHRMRTILTGLIRSHRDIDLVRKQKKALAQMQAQLFEQDKIKVLSELSSGIAHDVNNVLTPIAAYASMLIELPDLPEVERIEYAKTILQASLDAAEVVRRLKGEYGADRAFSRSSSTNLRRLLMDSLSLARPRLAQREADDGLKVSLSAHAPSNLSVSGNAAELRQALLNVLINAIEAMQGDGLITVQAREDSQHVIIEVQDNGSGMTEEVLHQCQDAYFTTKGNKGTGLGLAMVVKTCTDHGGHLSISSELNLGTLISMRLPKKGTLK